MPRQLPPPFTVRGATIMYRNFQGKASKFNAPGDRNFDIVLPEDLAHSLERDGWNVKWREPREDDEGGERTPHIQIKVKFEIKPPKIIMISQQTGARNPVFDDTVSLLDMVDVVKLDLTAVPYPWDIGGREGITAYLKTMYITIFEDELDLEYSDTPIRDEQDG